MKLNIRLLALFVIGLALAACSGTPDPLREIKLSLKNKRAADALKRIEVLARDTAYSPDRTFYDLGLTAARKLYEAENEKLYLRRNPDTAAYFHAQYAIYIYALRGDSVSRLRSPHRETGEGHAQLSLLFRIYPNFATASRYFLTKEKWSDAARFARMTLELPSSPIFGQRAPRLSPSLEYQNAEDYLYARYAEGNFEEAPRFADIALRDSAHRSSVLRALVLNCEAARHTDRCISFLKNGVREFPADDFFFRRLATELLAHNEEQTLLKLVDSLLPLRENKATLHEVQAQTYDRLHKDTLCLRAAQALQTADSTRKMADYYIGKSYVSMARSILLPTSIKSPGYAKAFKAQRRCYEEARPHLERFRKSSPDAPRLWAPLLYEIYLNLNLGKEFEEISRYNPS